MEAAVPLLEKKRAVYWENCPGCLVEQRKELCTGIPYREFFYVWICTLCTALPISSLFPFLYFMIRDLNIAERVEDIGFYAGFVGASFMLGRALTSMIWGILADRHGRKPVLMFAIFAVVVFNTLFGLSVNYTMAIVTRLLLGALNGLLGPIKAYAVEVARPEHQALSVSLVSTAWGIGLIIGPAIGGYLAQPAEKYPNIFSPDSLFGRFPYFLPCLCISLFAVAVFIGSFWLPETLHKHDTKGGDRAVERLESSPCLADMKQNATAHERPNLLKNWPLMSSIIVYCIFSLHDMAYTEIFSIWAESNKKYGGLSFSSQDVGQVLAISGFSLLVYQLFLYPPFERMLGSITLSRIGFVLSIPLLISYPFMTHLSGVMLHIVVNTASVLKTVFAVTIVTGLFILQNNAVSQEQRGVANGIAMTAMSIFKAVAPAVAGAVFTWAQKRQQASFLPGDQMVFFILNVVLVVGLVITFKPFLALPSKQGGEGER